MTYRNRSNGKKYVVVKNVKATGENVELRDCANTGEGGNTSFGTNISAAKYNAVYAETRKDRYVASS
jgi:hypothetical protein